MFASFVCASTLHVNPPPLTDVSVCVLPFQTVYRNTRVRALAAVDVVSVIVVPPAFSVFVPRFLSNATAAGGAPVPPSEIDCGLSAALSAIRMLALRAPVERGVKVAEIVHVAFGASVAGVMGQVFELEKSDGLLPPREIPEMVSAEPPTFFKVTDCATEVVDTVTAPKVREPGVNETAGDGDDPVPASDTLCGLSEALSTSWRLAEREPAALGLKTTPKVHVDPPARVAGAIGHVEVVAKSAAFAPVTL